MDASATYLIWRHRAAAPAVPVAEPSCLPHMAGCRRADERNRRALGGAGGMYYNTESTHSYCKTGEANESAHIIIFLQHQLPEYGRARASVVSRKHPIAAAAMFTGRSQVVILMFRS